MSSDLLMMIRIFRLKADERDLDIPAKEFYSGSSVLTLGDASDFDLVLSKVPGWRYEERWGNGYRSVWVNEAERAIFTYVEGDLDLTVDDTVGQFDARLRSAEEFYKGR